MNRGPSKWFCKLQILHCPGRQRCHECRRPLHAIARWANSRPSARDIGIANLTLPFENAGRSGSGTGDQCVRRTLSCRSGRTVGVPEEFAPVAPTANGHQPEPITARDFCDVSGQTMAKGKVAGRRDLARQTLRWDSAAFEEAIETTKVHSGNGHAKKMAACYTTVPFRTPYHTFPRPV